MGQLIAGLAGAAIGAPFGMAGLGFSLGSGLYNLLNRPDPVHQTAPLMDLKVAGTEYGQPLPYVRGAMRLAPQIIWNTDRIPDPTTTTSGGEGKGGGAPEQSQTTFTYSVDLLYLYTANPIVGVARRWDNGDLIYRSDSGASAGTIAASNAAEQWDRWTVYTGADDQLPDPDYETAIDSEVAANSAPAYRQRGTSFVKGLKLGSSGQLRNLTDEVVVDGSSGPLITYFDQDFTSGAADSPDDASTYVSETQEVWTIESPDNPARIAVRNLADETVTFIDFPPDYSVQVSISTPKKIIYVPERGKVLVAARSTTGAFPRTALVYDAQTKDYIGAWHDATANTFGSTPLGINVNSDQCFIGDENGNAQIWNIDGDCMPVSLVATLAREPTFALNADDDVFWFLLDGAHTDGPAWIGFDGFTDTVVPLSADAGLYNDPDQICKDTLRNCAYFWAAIAAGAYLLKFDFATQVISRVNSVAYSTSPYAIQGAKIEYEPLSDRIYVLSGGVGSAFKAWVLDPDDGSIDREFAIPDTNGAHFAGQFGFTNGVIWSASSQWAGGSESGIGELRFDALTIECPSVEDVQSDICLRAGLTAGQIDVTPLSAITRTVCCLPWSQVTPARDPSERMMGVFFYECTMSGRKVKFVPRGGSAVTTIPYEDLNASENGSDADPFPLRKQNDIELPAHKAITYLNLDGDYQNATELSDRLISATSQSVEATDIQIGMTPAEAKGVADTHSLDQAASVAGATITVMRLDYPTLEPTDPIIVTADDGSLIRMRIVEMTETFPLLTLRLVLDDTSVLITQGITSTDYSSQTTVTAPANTTMRLLDIPMLRGEDDFAGPYVETKGDRSPYPGAAVFASNDNITYERVATVTESAVFGSCTTTLGDWTGPRVFDFTNSVTVNVGDGTLASSTRAAVMGSREVNAYAIGTDATGYELGQFIDAELLSSSPNIYKLTRFLRGGLGTEWRMTGHVAGERFFLLRREGLRKIRIENSQLGASRYYKGVTLGRVISSATAQTFTCNGVAQETYSPARVRVSRDGSNNATISITRRTRYGVRYTGPLGISVPLGEQSEAYSIDFYTDGTFTTIADTQSVLGTNVFEYTAAAQTAAGLTPGDNLYMKVYQLSAIVGRGYPLQRAT